MAPQLLHHEGTKVTKVRKNNRSLSVITHLIVSRRFLYFFVIFFYCFLVVGQALSRSLSVLRDFVSFVPVRFAQGRLFVVK